MPSTNSRAALTKELCIWIRELIVLIGLAGDTLPSSGGVDIVGAYELLYIRAMLCYAVMLGSSVGCTSQGQKSDYDLNDI
jgi:hypothetical protein